MLLFVSCAGYLQHAANSKNKAKSSKTGREISIFYIDYNSIAVPNQYIVRDFSEILNPKLKTPKVLDKAEQKC
jgi:hypothetical protein